MNLHDTIKQHTGEAVADVSLALQAIDMGYFTAARNALECAAASTNLACRYVRILADDESILWCAPLAVR